MVFIALIEKTGAIGAGIYALVDKAKGLDTMLIIILTCLFSFLGGLGFAEGGIPFVPLAVTLSVALGYNKLVGAGASILGLSVGFTAGFLNNFTTGVGQAILGLPLYSGIIFRLVSWVIFTVIACIYVVSYANKVKKDSSGKHGNHANKDDSELQNKEALPFTTSRVLILISLAVTIAFQIYGSLKLGWYLPQLSTIYIMLAIATGIFAKMNPNDVAIELAKGASAILPAALAIGLARSVLIIMNQGQILDTIINAWLLRFNSEMASQISSGQRRVC